MNQDRVEKIVKDLFPELEITIKSFEKLPRFKYNDDKWVPDRDAYFIGVSGNGIPTNQINESLTTFTGYEFNFFWV